MENKFKKGLILGGILAAVAAVGFVINKSKEGQQLTEELQKDLKTLAKDVRKSLNKLEDVTKEDYKELVNTIVEDYTQKKELVNDAKNVLITSLQAMWQEMEEEYLADKEDEKIKK